MISLILTTQNQGISSVSTGTVPAMTTPPTRPPWLWILTTNGHLLRADQIIAVETSSDAVHALVAIPETGGSTYSGGGPVRVSLAKATNRDDAEYTAAKLLQFVGEHLAAGHAGVVAFDGEELELTQWPQA